MTKKALFVGGLLVGFALGLILGFRYGAVMGADIERVRIASEQAHDRSWK